MASSKKLPASKPFESLQQQLKVFLVDVFIQKNLVNPKLKVAFSGGLDSAVLLHVLVECQKGLSFQLSAHHIHHGLSPFADDWSAFCTDVCSHYKIPLTISKLQIDKNSGLGIEAAARKARYEALLDNDVDMVVLAHHQDDQAETLLLQLARGAGVKGMAGMPVNKDKLLRPFLEVSRSQLASYAKQHDLTWVEDESNADTQFDRNYVRHEVLPTLEKRYPAIRQTISRAAQNMADVASLLEEIAEHDAAVCINNGVLDLAQLEKLGQSRANNLLRWWLAQHLCEIPSAAQLLQISQQLRHAKSDANLKIKVSPCMVIRRYRGKAYLTDQSQHVDLAFRKTWAGEEEIRLPDGSRLVFIKKIGEGIALSVIAPSSLMICYRQGAELLRPQANRPRRTLKSLFQSANIPPWRRQETPLIYLGDQLAMIPDVATEFSLLAQPHELGVTILRLSKHD